MVYYMETNFRNSCNDCQMNRTGNIFRITMLLTALMFASVEMFHSLLHDCCGETAGELCQMSSPEADDEAKSVYASSYGTGHSALKAGCFCPVCSGLIVSTLPVSTDIVVPVPVLVPEVHPVRTCDPPARTVLLPLVPRPPPVC